MPRMAKADTEHTIEYGETGTWQAGTIYWASCECGWQSDRGADQGAVEAAAHRHQTGQKPDA
jgi:hypothetical protein